MNGEHLEYRVESLQGTGWRAVSMVYDDPTAAQNALAIFRRDNPGFKFRLAVRTTTDWCEATEGGVA